MTDERTRDANRVERLDDVTAAVATIVLAFAADPFIRWLFPRGDDFLTHFTELTRIHAGRSARHRGAFGLADGSGAALWYPPGAEPDLDALRALFDRTGTRERMRDVYRQTRPYEPEGPAWYLMQIGVDPRAQGGGAGARLMDAALADIDNQGSPAYLEATSERSVPFYERFGFRVLATVQAGDAPPLWPMVRDAP